MPAVLPAALNRPGELASTSQHLDRFYHIVLLHSEANLMLKFVKKPQIPGPKAQYEIIPLHQRTKKFCENCGKQT